MCQFGDESKILSEFNLTENGALIGWRNNRITNSFNDKEKLLKSIHKNYLYPKNNPANGSGLERDNSLGIYNYNNYYYYNNNNYYNYYNYYYYNNYNNKFNYYDYYTLQIKTLHYGKVFKYIEGYRSEFCKVTHLVILDKNSEWFSDKETIKFASHFNELCEKLASEYGAAVMEYSLCS